MFETLEYQVAVVGCCSSTNRRVGGSLAAPVCVPNKLGQDTKYTKLLFNASIDRNRKGLLLVGFNQAPPEHFALRLQTYLWLPGYLWMEWETDPTAFRPVFFGSSDQFAIRRQPPSLFLRLGLGISYFCCHKVRVGSGDPEPSLWISRAFLLHSTHFTYYVFLDHFAVNH